MSTIDVRQFTAGDESALQTVLSTCFHGIETWSLEQINKLTSSPDFEPKTLLLAIVQGTVAACVRMVPLPRGDAYVIRELAALTQYDAEAVVDILLQAALGRLEAAEPAFIRARTPVLEPYLSAYRRRSFTPVRRVVRISWDLTGPAHGIESTAGVRITQAGAYDADVLAGLYLTGLRPFWDWWIADHSGPSALRSVLTKHFQSIPDQETWLVAELNREPVGLSGVSLATGQEVVLEGVYVLPEFRGRGIGSVLMSATLAELRRAGREKLVVHDTFSFLDSHAPAVRLYLKSGGRMEAEYLHLEKRRAG